MKDDQKLAGVLNDPTLSKLWTWLKRKIDLLIVYRLILFWCSGVIYSTVVCFVFYKIHSQGNDFENFTMISFSSGEIYWKLLFFIFTRF